MKHGLTIRILSCFLSLKWEAFSRLAQPKFAATCKMGIGIFLCSLILWLAGCGSLVHPGETEAEAQRRHLRNARINEQQLMADIDIAILADKPSKLTDKRIP
jgi:hypothetical protein